MDTQNEFGANDKEAHDIMKSARAASPIDGLMDTGIHRKSLRITPNGLKGIKSVKWKTTTENCKGCHE